MGVSATNAVYWLFRIHQPVGILTSCFANFIVKAIMAGDVERKACSNRSWSHGRLSNERIDKFDFKVP
jgi:hypothetical protein